MTDEGRRAGGPPAGSPDERAEQMRLHKEEVVLSTLRAKLEGLDLRDAAEALGGRYDEEAGTLELYLLDQRLWVDEHLEVRTAEGAADYEDTAIVLNALRQPGGRPGQGWRAFRELASGHAGDFREEAEKPLAAVAAEVAERPERAASAVGGRLVESVAGSDATIEAPVFPNVNALIQIFEEDMEFPAEARILFSDGTERFLPPGCLEELGSRLADRIRRAVA